LKFLIIAFVGSAEQGKYSAFGLPSTW